MDKRKYSQIIKERVVRHNRLMKLIKNYSLTDEQLKRLDKIKMNTMMQINIRYLRSDHNRYYKFPKTQEPDDNEDEELCYDPIITKRQNIIYDLKMQNQVAPVKSVSQKILSLDNSRKVLSLQIEKSPWQRDKILRLNVRAKQKIISRNPTRKNSFSQRKREGSRLKLPELKIERGRQNLKTEIKGIQQDHQIHSVIGKKLMTQNSESTTKLRGVQKYLKKIEVQQKQNQQKGNFKRKVFFPQKIS